MSDQQELARRVQRVRDLMAERGYDAIILRNNPDLRWLTGAVRCFDDEPAHVAFVTQDGLRLHTDSRYHNSFLERMGKDSPWQIDMQAMPAPEWAASRIEAARARVVAIEDTVSVSFLDGLKAACSARGIACLVPRLHSDIMDLRMVKDEDEIELMRRAQAVTDRALEHICAFIRVGRTEQELRAELEGFMLSNGADALSFDTIVAAGPNGANPHARPSGYVIQKGDLVVLDYGAGYLDYHSDMTRTVCVGEPSEEQRRVYDVVRLAHETCAAALKPGCRGRDIHELAVRVIADAGYGDYFNHGLGHGVGLEIHEQPSLGRLYDKPVPRGSVVTIEPGIYLPGRFGVRLEDCGVVGEDGFEPLTRSSHELRIVG